MQVEVQEAKWFNGVKALLPEGCLCGTGDELLGSIEKVVPSGVGDDQLTMLPDSVVFVQGLVV